MDSFARDAEVPPDDDEASEEPTPRDVGELPEEPTVIIYECELNSIDKGDPEVKGCATALVEAAALDPAALDDPTHWIWDRALELRRRELVERAKGHDGMSTLYQLRQSCNSAVGALASRVARISSSMRFEKSLVGDLKKRINQQLSKLYGRIDLASEEDLRTRYAWLKNLEKTILAEGVPAWLR
jgi:hypothetical protein